MSEKAQAKTNHPTRESEAASQAAFVGRSSAVEGSAHQTSHSMGRRLAHDYAAISVGKPDGAAPLPALELGPKDDLYEREAEHVSVGAALGLVGGFDEQLEGEPRTKVHRKLQPSSSMPAGSQVNQVLSQDIQDELGHGSALATDLRQPMEAAFGFNFSQVKIHRDAKSERLNQELEARAFTVGGDIFFGRGEYSPESLEGRSVLAHELTHVVQQRGSALAIQRLDIKELMRGGRDYIDKKMKEYSKNRIKALGKKKARALVEMVADKNRELLSHAKSRYGFYFKEVYRENGGPEVEFSSGRAEASTSAEGSVVSASPQLTLDDEEDAKPQDVAARILGVGKEHEKAKALAALYESDLEKAERIARAVNSVLNAEPVKEVTVNGKSISENTAKITGQAVLEEINFINGVKAFAQASAEFSQRRNLKAEVNATFYAFMAKASLNASTFVGIVTEAEARFSLDVLEGLQAKLAAKAEVGAKAKAALDLKFDLGELAGMEVNLEGEAFAGATGSGILAIAIGPGGLTFEGEVEAFVGAKAGGKAEWKATFLGEETLALGVEGSVATGLGFRIAGGFSIEGGKLKLDASLAFALGLGIGLGVNIEIDYRQILQAIADKITETYDLLMKERQGYSMLLEESDIVERTKKSIEAFRKERREHPSEYGGSEAIRQVYLSEIEKVDKMKLTPVVAQYYKDVIWRTFQKEFDMELQHLFFLPAPHPEQTWSALGQKR